MECLSVFPSPRIFQYTLGFVYYTFLVQAKIVVFSLCLIYLANIAFVLSVFFARIMTSNIFFVAIVTRRIHIFSFTSFSATPCISSFAFIPSSIAMRKKMSVAMFISRFDICLSFSLILAFISVTQIFNGIPNTHADAINDKSRKNNRHIATKQCREIYQSVFKHDSLLHFI